MEKKLRVGVIFGGRSGEHEVSLVSATSIIAALNKDKYEIVPIGICKNGRWVSGENLLQAMKEADEGRMVHAALPADPTLKRLFTQDEAKRFIAASEVNVLFPVLHGPLGEDGTIQGLFELMDLPYVGASVLGSAMAMDKTIQKNICRQHGLPTVEFLWVHDVDWVADGKVKDQLTLPNQLANMSQKEMLRAIIDRLGLPAFVKPPNLGSSLGITKAHNRKELYNGIVEALQYDRKVMIEKAVANAREIEVSVLGNERARASAVGEIIPCNEFYDYDAKYVDGASKLIIPAELPDWLSTAIRDTAVKAAIATECEGMVRADFLLDAVTNVFYLNELNTIPGFTKISMYPKLWEASGLSYADLLDELINLALARFRRRHALRTSYQPKRDWYRE
ncbi:D-alanine--D-alanine ligase [candidate division KSB1 bacterium]|nr:D-alanine--D-alanine ligase [candidate division KSB1 bacterium]